ncbi:poly polymerase gamma [Stylonychia lemnae]|uniref:polynucleotide adenylyltransferase n=1 Tax=Stylonychia lemnae TaxID=5949 RepID=A0A078A7F9_STYLE|nr:poly polymerase gamma [Stylonychia lemnae]|eukprot:CDW77806.1 poly polymerase gamma [Stylonychia lemnae]
MADKKHHRQKTMVTGGGGNNQSYQNNNSSNQQQPFNQQQQSSNIGNFTKKSYPKKNYSQFKNQDQNQIKQNSVFDDPFEESSYLKFLMSERYHIYEDIAAKERRYEALQKLKEIINQWQIDHAVNVRKINQQEAQKRQSCLLPFGSYEMGVHFPDTDMDLICVFPQYILQEDFFNTFKTFITSQKDVENVIDVVDARVPILKLKFMGNQIDLLYACIDPKLLNEQVKIQKIIKDEQVFNKLNQVSQNSLNGLKATQNLIKSVPNPRKFKIFLRCIKLWAQRRGIYSNTFGYLGGISYAILVAKICQDHPDLELVDLVHKFFEVYSEWKWFDPVFIKIGKKKDNTKLDLNKLQVLDAYSQDIMPILTPNTNPKNSAYRVCQLTFDTICSELYRGKQILKQLAPSTLKVIKQPDEQEESIPQTQTDNQEEIKGGDLLQQQILTTSTISLPKKICWTKLFQRFRFFGNYNHFIRVDVLSTDESGHLKWQGYVESQLRRLIQLFQDVEQIQGLRIYPRALSRDETRDTMNDQFKCCDSYFIGIKFNETGSQASVNLREQVINFCNFLEIGRVTKQINNVRILHFKKSELPEELIEKY